MISLDANLSLLRSLNLRHSLDDHHKHKINDSIHPLSVIQSSLNLSLSCQSEGS